MLARIFENVVALFLAAMAIFLVLAIYTADPAVKHYCEATYSGVLDTNQCILKYTNL